MSNKIILSVITLLLITQILSGCRSNQPRTSLAAHQSLLTAQTMIESGDQQGAKQLLSQINAKELRAQDRYLRSQLVAQLGQPLKIKKAVLPKMAVFFQPRSVAKGINYSGTYYINNQSCPRCKKKYYVANLTLRNTRNVDYSFKMDCLVHVFRKGKLASSGFFDNDYHQHYRLTKNFNMAPNSQFTQKLIFDTTEDQYAAKNSYSIANDSFKSWYGKQWRKDIKNKPYCTISALRADSFQERKKMDMIKQRINQSINHCKDGVALTRKVELAPTGKAIISYEDLYWIKNFSVAVKGGVKSVSELDRLNGINSRESYTISFKGKYYRTKQRFNVIDFSVYGNRGSSKKWSAWKNYKNELSQAKIQVINGKIRYPKSILAIHPLSCNTLPVK